jgi:hypothetical protein
MLWHKAGIERSLIDHPPTWLLYASRLLLPGALLFVLALLVPALAGVSEPRPTGSPVIDARLALPLVVEAPGAQASSGTGASLQPPGSVMLRMAWVSGPREARYGLRLISRDGLHELRVLVNANGYLEITLRDGEDVSVPYPLARFPHVRVGSASNDLRADFSSGEVTIRVNKEWAAAFTWLPPPALQAEAMLEAGARGGTHALAQHLRTWEEGHSGPTMPGEHHSVMRICSVSLQGPASSPASARMR